MTVEIHKAGGRFEDIGSYARAKRIGPFAYTAGTTAIEPTGKIHAPYDASIGHFLNGFEVVNRDNPFDGSHWFIDHAETISDRNIERIRALAAGSRSSTGWRSRGSTSSIATGRRQRATRHLRGRR